MTKPSYLEVCAGELDSGACSPTVVMEFSELIKADQVLLIPDQGNQLDRSIVQSFKQLLVSFYQTMILAIKIGYGLAR